MAAAMFDAFMVNSADAAPIEPPEAVRAVAGNDAKVTALPVVFDPAEGKTGIQPGVVWRVTAGDGQTRFVDPTGRTYQDLKDFVDNNKFPEGRIRIPRGGQLTLASDGYVEFEEIDKVRSTFDHVAHWTGVAVDVLAVLGFGAITVAAIVGTGGLATPLAAAAWIAIGASTAKHTWDAASDLMDRNAHGQSAGPSRDTAGDYIAIGSALLTPVALGAPRLIAAAIPQFETGVAISKGVAGGAWALNSGATVYGAAELVGSWDDLPLEDKVLGVANLLVTCAGAAATGAHGLNARKMMQEAADHTAAGYVARSVRGGRKLNDQQWNAAIERLARTPQGREMDEPAFQSEIVSPSYIPIDFTPTAQEPTEAKRPSIRDLVALVRANENELWLRAGKLAIDPLTLRSRLLLQLPRLVTGDALPGAHVIQREILAVSKLIEDIQRPCAQWLAKPERPIELGDLEFIPLDADTAKVYHERLHYVGSYRPGQHFAFRDKVSGRIVCVGSVASFDLKHAEEKIPSYIDRQSIAVFSRFFAFRWAPKNTFSHFWGRLRRQLRDERDIKLMFSFINPNMGFDGRSHKAAQWQLFALEAGARYMYLDGRYRTMRYFVENYGTSDAGELKRKLGHSFVVSTIDLDPIQLLACPVQRRARKAIPEEPYKFERPVL
jgi:hypothetical protein